MVRAGECLLDRRPEVRVRGQRDVVAKDTERPGPVPRLREALQSSLHGPREPPVSGMAVRDEGVVNILARRRWHEREPLEDGRNRLVVTSTFPADRPSDDFCGGASSAHPYGVKSMRNSCRSGLTSSGVRMSGRCPPPGISSSRAFGMARTMSSASEAGTAASSPRGRRASGSRRARAGRPAVASRARAPAWRRPPA